MPWAPVYATTDELKAFVRVSGAVDDAFIALDLAAASRAVDRACHRQFGAVAAPEARTYPVRYSRHRGKWIVTIDDVQTAVGATFPAGVDPPTLEPRNAVLEGLAWTEAYFSADPSDPDGMATFSMRWGWVPSWPDPVKLATLLQGSRLVARRESPFGVAGSPQTGSELRLLERLDPDVAVIVKAYSREVWAR